MKWVGVNPIGTTKNAIRSVSIGAHDATLQCHIRASHQPNGGLAAGRPSKSFWVAWVNGSDIKTRWVRILCWAWNLRGARTQKNAGANGQSKHLAPPAVYDGNETGGVQTVRPRRRRADTLARSVDIEHGRHHPSRVIIERAYRCLRVVAVSKLRVSQHLRWRRSLVVVNTDTDSDSGSGLTRPAGRLGAAW